MANKRRGRPPKEQTTVAQTTVAQPIDTSSLMPEVKREFEALAETVFSHHLIPTRTTERVLAHRQALEEAIAAHWADKPPQDIKRAQTSLCIQAYVTGRAQAADFPSGP